MLGRIAPVTVLLHFMAHPTIVVMFSMDEEILLAEPNRAQLSRAYQLLLGEKPTEGIAALRELASAGSLLSMVYIGWAYKKGIGIKTDLEQAENWYRRAADAGSLPAYYHLGRLYLDTRRYQKAEQALSFAANNDFAPALHYLARMYLYALGVDQDVVKARRLLERSYELGNLYAKRALGFLLIFYGQGWPERLRGMRLYFAARKELTLSQFKGEIYQ